MLAFSDGTLGLQECLHLHVAIFESQVQWCDFTLEVGAIDVGSQMNEELHHVDVIGIDGVMDGHPAILLITVVDSGVRITERLDSLEVTGLGTEMNGGSCHGLATSPLQQSDNGATAGAIQDIDGGG